MPDEQLIATEQEVDRQALDEVIAEARDLVGDLEVQLQQVRTGTVSGEEAARRFGQAAQSLHLRSRTVQLPGLTPLTHRLADYLAALKSIELRHIDDLQVFADRIAAFLDGDTDITRDIASVVRTLPSKAKTFDVSDVTYSEIDVLLVMPQRSAARAVERELAACGYVVSIVIDPFEAIQIAVETRPDLIITAMVMDRLSGVDMACALNAMPVTRSIPVCLLTSLSLDAPELKALPPHTGIIRRGPAFGDDLAHVLQRFTIT